MRYELPPGLTDEEVRAIEAALDSHFGTAVVRPSPWALAGRAFAIGLGALQIRYQSLHPWSEITLNPFTRRGTEPRIGRGDTK
jgi:hypothetical protein